MPRKPAKRSIHGLCDLAISQVQGFNAGLMIDRETLRSALRDLLDFWDRRDDSGWTAAEARRLEEIRKLVRGDS